VFYLLVPLLGALVIRLAARHGMPPVGAAFVPVALFVAIGFAAKAALRVWPGLGQVWEVSFLPHADWFAAGMTVAVLRVLWEQDRLRLPRGWRPTAAVAAVAFALLGVGLYASHTLTRLEYQSLIAVACGLVLALVVLAPPGSGFVRALSWRPIVAAGLASYSVFLWHDPFVRWFRDEGVTMAGRTGFFLNLLLIASLTAVLSTLTYLFVERPALARKSRSQPQREAASPQPEPAQEPAPSSPPAIATGPT
jgi:peptidoglycan/LPS O-acetylase OafA/YrhL